MLNLLDTEGFCNAD